MEIRRDKNRGMQLGSNTKNQSTFAKQKTEENKPHRLVISLLYTIINYLSMVLNSSRICFSIHQFNIERLLGSWKLLHHLIKLIRTKEHKYVIINLIMT